MEWKLFDGDEAPFTDAEFYKDRVAAHHLEEYGHHDRLMKAADLIIDVARGRENGELTVSDLGCGDGGLLQVLDTFPEIHAWGYDMQPTNIEYARKMRGVEAYFTDFKKSSDIEYGRLTVMTEVLEHISDPHGTLESVPSKYVVMSSPFHETGDAHYEFHNWAWDIDGYKALAERAGYRVLYHDTVWLNQIILGVRID